MSQFFESLDREWERVATSSEARRAVARWQDIEPVLAGENLTDLLERRRRSAADGAAILDALARLAPRDRVAARTLLQAIIPGLGALARRLGGGRPDLAAELASLAWERIRTYPTRRPGSVGANILLDVRKGYAASCRPPRTDVQTEARPHVVHFSAALSAEDEVLVEEDRRPDVLRRILVAGDRGVISDVALRAIVRTRLHGETVEEAAAGEAVSVTVLRHRRWRGERALRDRLGHLPLAG